MSFNLDPPPSTVKEFTFHWKTWLNNLYEWLRLNVSKDFLFEISAGNVDGYTVIHKFGHSDSISTTLVAICTGNVYQVPTSAQSLELVSTNAADNQAGIGARTVTIIGLDANYAEQTVIANMHATDGTIAEAVTGTWTRVYRMFVETTGTYATAIAGSHQGEIDLQGSGGGVLWARLEDHGGFPLGQSQIGVYTVPEGKTALVGNIITETDSNKEVDIVFFKRADCNIVTAPFSPMRAQAAFTGITDNQDLIPKTWMGPFDEFTDVGFMAVRSSAGNSSVSVDFEIVLIDK